MKRTARLQAAVKWRSGYGGKNLVRGYARWFGVDLLCAVAELRMLGVPVDAVYEQQLRQTFAARGEARLAKRAEKMRPVEVEWPADWPVEWIPSDEPEIGTAFDENPF